MLSPLERENLQKIRQVKNLTNLLLGAFCVACIFLRDWITKFDLWSYIFRMLISVVRIWFVLLWAPQQQMVMHEGTSKCTFTVEICVNFYMMLVSPKKSWIVFSAVVINLLKWMPTFCLWRSGAYSFEMVPWSVIKVQQYKLFSHFVGAVIFEDMQWPTEMTTVSRG